MNDREALEQARSKSSEAERLQFLAALPPKQRQRVERRSKAESTPDQMERERLRAWNTIEIEDLGPDFSKFIRVGAPLPTQGNMGVVYEAFWGERRLVVKTLGGPGRPVPPEALTRFLREMNALAALDHPHIVSIAFMGIYEDAPCFAMEYVAGATLASRLESAPLADVRQAVELVEKLARAIHHAHEKGIIHRDLKPANVLLSPEGQPKIADFGVARLLADEGHRTEAGTPLGTPEYMAPEQANGQEVDRRADVYALGVILYRLLTGRLPFSRADQEGIASFMVRLQNEEPPPLKSVPQDPALICSKCLEKDPAKRYATADALADDLKKVLEYRIVGLKPPTAWERVSKWSRRKPVRAVAFVAAAVLGVVLAASTLILWDRNTVIEGQVLDLENQKIVIEGQVVRIGDQNKNLLRQRDEAREQNVRQSIFGGMQFLADGNLQLSLPWFARAAGIEGQPAEREEIHRMRLAAVLRQCPALEQIYFHSAKVAFAAFSSDGKSLATACEDGTARVWDVSSGEPRTLPLKHPSAVNQVTFSPDGKRLLTSCNVHPRLTQMWDVSVPAKPVSLWSKPHPEWVSRVIMSPDGRLVVTACEGKLEVMDAVTGKPAGPSPTDPALRFRQAVTLASFSGDASYLMAVGSSQEARVWDTKTWKFVKVDRIDLGQIRDAAFTPDGQIIATAAGRHVLLWNTATGNELTQVPSVSNHLFFHLGTLEKGTEERVFLPLEHPADVFAVSFSPDGFHLATASNDRAVRVFNPLTRNVVRLPHPNGVALAGFSPDGRRLVTATGGAFATEDGEVRLWDTRSGVPLAPPLRHRGPVTHAAFSPDGSRLVTTCEDGTARVWSLTGREPFEWRPGAGDSAGQAVLSRDGGRLVTTWQPNITKPTRVTVWDTATGRPVADPLVRAEVHSVTVSDDGGLLALTDKDGVVEVRVVGAANGVPLRHSAPVGNSSFSANGLRLLTTAGKTARLWDVKSAEAVSLEHDAPVSFAALSPSAARIVTLTEGGALRVWDALGKLLSPSAMKHTAASGAGFSPDGERLVSFGYDKDAFVWEIASGKAVRLSHDDWVTGASFDGTGARVVTAGKDPVARVWDAGTGQPLTPHLPHRAGVRGALFHLAGRCVLTGDEDGSLRIWDSHTGDPVTPTMRNAGRLQAIRLSGDGRRLVALSLTQGQELGELPLLQTWNLRPEGQTLASLVSLAGLHSGLEVDATGSLARAGAGAWKAAWNELRKGQETNPRAAEARVRAWHERQAQECEFEGEWVGAIQHLDRLIACGPSAALHVRCGRANGLRRQWGEAAKHFVAAQKRGDPSWKTSAAAGRALAETGEYEAAAGQFAKAYRSGASDLDPASPDTPYALDVWYQHALLQLATGNVKEYRSVAEALLKRADPDEAETVTLFTSTAWLSVLGDDALPDPKRVLRLAKELGVTNVGALPPADTILMRGFVSMSKFLPREPDLEGPALYRNGKYAEAVERLLVGGDAVPGRQGLLARPRPAEDLLFLAMAFQRDGKAKEAKARLAEATALIEKLEREGVKGEPLPWHQRLEQKVLGLQARKLIQGK